jgi:hypothetical protein
MNLFDSNTYPRAERPGRCTCCHREVLTVTGPAAYRHKFKALTGISWPGLLFFNLQKDFRSLGLDAVHVPDSAPLCLVCAVDYMTEFNARLGRKWLQSRA